MTSEFVDRELTPGEPEGVSEDPAAMERRIFYGMRVTVAVAVAISAAVAPWRVTTGLFVGGLLSLFNHHWLRTSVAAMFKTAVGGARPKFRIARYLLRYVVVAIVIGAAYQLDLVSLVATLAGLCSFVVAALFEGFTQLYIAISHREET